MAYAHFRKCNVGEDFGFLDLIYRVMQETGRPMGSGEVWEIALEKGYVDLLYAGKGQIGRTPRSTHYARMVEQARNKNGFLTRFEDPRTGKLLYEIIPGRTPKTSRKIDYETPNTYVYCIFDPLTCSPIYFGMGKGVRKDAHLAGFSHSRELMDAIAYIRSLGREPDCVVIAENMTREQSLRYEAACIRAYGRRGIEPTGVLFNKKSSGVIRGRQITESEVIPSIHRSIFVGAELRSA